MKILYPILGFGTLGTGLLIHWIATGPRCRFTGSCRALAVGDSITAGGHYARYLDSALDRYVFDIVGEVGAGTGQILRNLQNALAQHNYDEIIVEGGLNDASQSDDYIINGLHNLVDAAKASGARVILLSLTPWAPHAQRIQAMNKRLWWLSKFWGCSFVDVWTPLADSAGALRGDLIGDASMHVHPNTAGHRLMAQAILNTAY